MNEETKSKPKYDSGDEVKLPNDRKGVVVDLYVGIFENVYDIDFGDGVLGNKVPENQIEEVIE